MISTPQGGGFQQQVLLRFTALMLLRESWAGELVLGIGLNESGAALALAANIAGAVCLSIEPDALLLKSAQRVGACDFVVNTLDEALRTMKNEVRQRRALSVGLLGESKLVLAEAVERGLLPAVIGAPNAKDAKNEKDAEVSAKTGALRELGAQGLSFAGEPGDALDAEALVRTWAQKRGLALYVIGADGHSGMTALDAELKRTAVPDDSLRMRWLERAAQHFRRERPLSRAVWLAEEEAKALRSAGRELGFEHGH